MIPNNITKEHILHAIERIDKEGIPNGADSDYYDVLYNGRRYPPKLIVSWANKVANGSDLDRDTFEGGINTDSFKLIDKEGFEIINKATGDSIFFDQLLKFLQQASGDDLKTATYLKQYKGLKMRVGFGQAVKSRVPWIALLKSGEEVQEGIYPVYLYSIQHKLLILAYGVSETNPPKNRWHFDEQKETLKEYFLQRFKESPFRYGNSYIFKTYALDDNSFFGLSNDEIIKDLDVIIKNYKTPSKKESTKSIKANSYKMAEHAQNTILYGPPGTGKTFNSISHAVAIIKGYEVEKIIEDQKKDPELRKQYRKEFDKLVSEGQIVFVTFHQSYGYEEFVEGIKPRVNLSGDIEYNIVDGIFKSLCLLAGEKRLSQNFDEVYDRYITKIMNSSNEYELKTPALSKPFVVKVNSKGSCVAIPKTQAATEMTITRKMIRSYVEHGTIEDWKSYLTAIAKDMTENEPIEFKTVDNTKNKFVLIIDEINRGNISKIFGELISLIESSKRIGANEELRLKLTYSGSENNELFGVPANLYILGTMNSTDRSIALIDTALRRRFTFIEYTAEPNLLTNNIEGINLNRLLSTLNKRIEFLLDKDHLIGHAYFWEVTSKDELCSVFRNKIIPLLEEYFYSDYEKIQFVLGDNNAFGKRDNLKLIQEIKPFDQRKLFGADIDGYEEKRIFGLNPDFAHQNFRNVTPDTFISIYQKL